MCIYVCMYVCMHACVCKYRCVSNYTYVHMRVCVCLHDMRNIYVHAYIHLMCMNVWRCSDKACALDMYVDVCVWHCMCVYKYIQSLSQRYIQILRACLYVYVFHFISSSFITHILIYSYRIYTQMTFQHM